MPARKPFKLTPEQARAKWVESLKSGKRAKTTGVLCELNEDKQPIGYCCLGDAVEVFVECEGADRLVGQARMDSGDNDKSCVAYMDTETQSVEMFEAPGVVREWLGLSHSNGSFVGASFVEFGTERALAHKYTSSNLGSIDALVGINDCTTATLADVGDFIATNPPGLFQLALPSPGDTVEG